MIKVSIIGTGRIGFLLENDPLRYKPCTHLGAVEYHRKSNKKLEWDLLCDINEERLQTAANYLAPENKKSAKKFSITQDYREVIANQPDILIIAADSAVHYPMVMDAIEAKIPRIVIEKPITTSKKQAARISKAAKKSNSKIWVNYERRYHPKYVKLKESLNAKKELGMPIYYRGWFASTNPHLTLQSEENEGALLHDTTHLLDLSQFLFGKVLAYQSYFTKNGEKKAKAQAGYPAHRLFLEHAAFNGISGEIVTTSRNSFFHFELEIIMEYGRIRVGNGFMQKEINQKSPYYKNFTSLSKPTWIPDPAMTASKNPFVGLYADVIKGRHDVSFFQDACENIALL